jgi:uroporphyrinogen decarboxylase
LGIPREQIPPQPALTVNFAMLPTFDEKVLEHRDGHYIVQDWMGAIVEISDEYDVTYLRSARDFVTRDWHSFPVQNRRDWEEKIRWRYDPADPRRFPADFTALCGQLGERQGLLSFQINGPFWQMREWCGFEGLCLLMAEHPDFVQEMADFWREFVLQMFERLLTHVQPDSVMISEDMAYKAHSMISPRMARRFLLPAWRAWIKKLRAHGDTVAMVDSDGYIGELLPLFIEAGFESTWPVEVAAGNDIVAYRQRYGRQIAFGGGVDKRVLAAGGDAMRAELDRLAPLIRDGGYLPGCDHGVPPDISWPNFVAYSRRLAELTGWLPV